MGRMRVLLMCGVVVTLFLLGCSSGGAGGGSGSNLVLLQAAPPDGMVGSFYWFAFTATGGTKPYTWNVTGGTLPSGLTLDSGKGTLSGKPTVADTYDFRLTVTDSGSPQQTASRWFSITILPSGSVLRITTISLPDAVQDENYSVFLTAIGGTPPYNWTISSGALPSGLNLDGATGEIHGTPTTVGTSSFTVTVTDASSNTASSSLSITVNPASLPPLPSLTQLAQGDFLYSHIVTVGEEFTVNAVENPSTGYTWLLESYDTSYLELVNDQYVPPSGNPPPPGTPGERHFTFKALKAGQTQIVMVYKRPWENDYYMRVTIKVTIK